MQNLVEKIAKMARDEGLVKFESESVFGRAAMLAVAAGKVKFYEQTQGHIVVAAVQ